VTGTPKVEGKGGYACRWTSKTEMVAGYAALTAFYLGILAALSFVLLA
jgi:hypothetical protein